jgi:hypothetical protein
MTKEDLIEQLIDIGYEFSQLEGEDIEALQDLIKHHEAVN